jgi:uncharacterized membrane protein
MISENHAPDEIYESVRKELSENEIVDLSYAIAAINAGIASPFLHEQSRETIALANTRRLSPLPDL